MRLFKSKEPNLVQYVTAVTYDRVPLRLIGYVVMPDHFHLLVNPLHLDISVIVGRLKGRAASLILKWLRAEQHAVSLAKLKLPRLLSSGQTHAVWLQDFSAIDVWSRKFIRQKLNYIHNNPVRAGLCDHPGKWRWSSYQAYFPHEIGALPIEIDQRWLWTKEELETAGISQAKNEVRRTSPASKQSIY